MAAQKGEKVLVTFYEDVETKTIYLIGEGTYVGDEIPDSDAMGLAAIVREGGGTNPKIVLDDGQVVWGCECWWAAKADAQAQIDARLADGWKIEPVNLNAERAEQRAIDEAE